MRGRGVSAASFSSNSSGAKSKWVVPSAHVRSSSIATRPALRRRRLREDPGDDHEEIALTAKTDPVLARLWDNPRDAAYDRLPRGVVVLAGFVFSDESGTKVRLARVDRAPKQEGGGPLEEPTPSQYADTVRSRADPSDASSVRPSPLPGTKSSHLGECLVQS